MLFAAKAVKQFNESRGMYCVRAVATVCCEEHDFPVCTAYTHILRNYSSHLLLYRCCVCSYSGHAEKRKCFFAIVAEEWQFFVRFLFILHFVRWMCVNAEQCARQQDFVATITAANITCSLFSLARYFPACFFFVLILFLVSIFHK